MIDDIQHILLDIEGTTCPVSFVSDVLFPYAKREVAAYLQEHGGKTVIQQLLQEMYHNWEQDLSCRSPSTTQAPGQEPMEAAPPMDDEVRRSGGLDATSVLPYLHWLIRQDRKLTAWKDLQGRIWREGYARGDLKADLFPEVPATLERWKQAGLLLSVYSSGSITAQQLLYGHSQNGDLRALFSHWFDTRIGAKNQTESYRHILQVLNCLGRQVLFISDSVAELRAAEEAGLQVIFSDREGNPQRDPAGFQHISGLDQLALTS